MIHVSWPILWVSPLVDGILFVVLGMIAVVVLRFGRRLPVLKILVFLLVMVCVYDWLTATGRLFHWSSFLLALGAGAAMVRWMQKHEATARNFFAKSFPWLVAAAVLVFVTIAGGSRFLEQRELAKLPPAVANSPNVLVIVIDTLRADHLSSYGYSRSTSPTIDRMGKEGTLFENAISTCSWSFPSHVSLVTGRYQFEHGMGAVPRMPVFGPAVPTFHGYPTLGQILENHGYRTAAFSANRTYFSHDLGFWQGTLHFEDYFNSPADAFVRTLYGREFSRVYLSRTEHSKPKRLLRWLGFESILDADEEGSGSLGGAQGVKKRATEVNRELLNWIGTTGKQRPFFAMINYFDVHAPYGGPRSFARPWPENDPVDLYDDSIRYVDDSLGALMSELTRRGFASNTLVVITSDHGESLGQHGLETHGAALYREQIHVPLIFWFPGYINSQRIPQEVSNATIPASVMALVAPQSNQPFPGPVFGAKTIVNIGHPSNWPQAISELAKNTYLGRHDKQVPDSIPTARTGAMKSLVSGQWHLIVHQGSGMQLYDWGTDPQEATNLASFAAGQATAAQLTEKMKEIMVTPSNHETSVFPWRGAKTKSD